MADRYAAVKSRLPPQVTLIAVSKTRTAEEVRALYDLGHRDFGENYAQELKEKQAALPKDIRWHFIGHLQRSNVKAILSFVHLIHGIDGERLLDEVDKRAGAIGRVVDVLLQVHIGQEETKHGFSPDELRKAAATWAPDRWPNVRIRGLMGMATNTEDNDLIAAEFRGLASLHRELKSLKTFDAALFNELSMGMSADAGLAVEAGSTMVRIGTALFGAR